jgi:hypothetical protein
MNMIMSLFWGGIIVFIKSQKIKNSVNKIFTTITLLLLFIIFSSSYYKLPKSAGAPAEKTGAPIFNTSKEGTCQTGGCHSDFAVNTGNAIFTIECINCNGYYMPGAEYTIRISITEAGYQKFGFQVVSLRKDSNLQAGTPVITDGIRTQVIGANSQNTYMKARKYVTHTFDGTPATGISTAQWEYSWIAPDNYSDTVVFYATALSANNDLETTGDYVYSSTLLLAAPPTGVYENRTDEISIYPNPTTNTIFFNNINEYSTIIFYDIQGKEIFQKNIIGKESIGLKNYLTEGTYLYSVVQNDLIIKSGRIILR